MSSPVPGQLPPPNLLIDPAALERAYFDHTPDPSDARQRVKFGTSGHRGNPNDGSFNEAHILAIVQATCEYRAGKGIDGPVFLGKDTHAACQAAACTALEVLAANGVEVVIAQDDDYTPTPVVSHAIITHNQRRTTGPGLADGLIITPSHNPPRDGGIKYNPPNGGPADVDVTRWIEDRANALLREQNKSVKRIPHDRALKAPTTHARDLIRPYVDDFEHVIDFEPLRSARLKIGCDPLGGASVHYWPAIAERYQLDLTVVNTAVDYTFRFVPVDHDGVIRMDCSSPHAMAGLVHLRDRYDVAFGNDPDADRHGIVTRSSGLMNPNHYLAVAIQYLFTHRPRWPKSAAVGKTLVSSGMIDRVAASIGRPVYEVPVGFKWFSSGLFDGSLGFGGEESAGASFLRQDGTVWTTDKDGPILCLLACEMTARLGKDPGEQYRELEQRFGRAYYRRVDQPATREQKAALGALSPESVTDTELARDPIEAKLTKAPGNHAPIGGLKVVTRNGWFAARPSGTEDAYKIYAESLKDEQHLGELLQEAKRLVSKVLR